MKAQKAGDILVTIGMNVYNGERFLREALDSALRQTHENLEILVYDDGSTDGTPAILASIADSRVRVIRAETNRGLGHGRRCLQREARGRYVTWLDADDVFLPNRVERLLSRALESDADIACDVYQYMSQDGRPLQQWHRIPEKVACEPHFTRLFERNVMIPHPLIRHTCLKSLSYDASFRHSEDYDFWLRCSFAGKRFVVCDEIGLRYRLTPGSLSKNIRRSREQTRKALSKHALSDVVQLYRARGYSAAHIHYMLCLQHIFRGRYEEALGYARRPWPGERDVDQDFYLGTLYLRTSCFPEARKHLETHLERQPESPAGLNNLGVLLESVGRDGSEHFQQALRVRPDYHDARQNLQQSTNWFITDTQL